MRRPSPYRDATFATVIAGMWPDPAHANDNVAWVRDFYEATAPHSEKGGYINFMSADDQERIRTIYRQNYGRVGEVERECESGNLFHLNQNVKP
jgi:Berberine and berberine like